MTARRYLAVVQDPRGYPAPGGELEPAPPEGPAPPVMHSVVLADDFERVERERDEGLLLVQDLREACWDAGSPTVPTPVTEALQALRAWQEASTSRPADPSTGEQP